MVDIRIPIGVLVDGQVYDLTLKHGDSERVLKNAKVVAFEQIERVYDEDHIAIDKTIETHYRAETKDQVVGFLPENVLTANKV